MMLVIVLLTVSAVNATDIVANSTTSDSVVCESHSVTSQTNTEEIMAVSEDSNSENTINDDVEKTSKSNSATTNRQQTVKSSNKDVLSYTPTEGDDVTVTDYNDLDDAVTAHKKIINLGGDQDEYTVTKIITITSELTINGNGKTITGASNLEHVFEIGENIKVIINNLKFEKNNVRNGTILNKGSLNINYCNFTENTAQYSGGAILNEGYLNIDYCNFTKNSANLGGVIDCRANGELLINNSMFINNSAHNGGALRIFDTTKNSRIENSKFEGNYIYSDGGVGSVFCIGDFVKLDLNNVILNKNYVKNIEQISTIKLGSGATLKMNKSIINGTANVRYAIKNEDGNLELSNSSITLNQVLNSIVYNTGNLGVIKLSDMNITNNHAEFSIIYSMGNSGVIKLSDMNITNNHIMYSIILNKGNTDIKMFNSNMINNTIKSKTYSMLYHESNSALELYYNNISDNKNGANEKITLICSNSNSINISYNTISNTHDVDTIIFNAGGTATLSYNNISNNDAVTIIYNSGKLTFLYNNLTNSITENAIYNRGTSTLSYNNISNNVNPNFPPDKKWYVVHNRDDNSVINIDHNLFVNNTDNHYDMLFNGAGTFNVANNNVFVGNYLNDSWNITDTIVDVISNKETPIHVIDLRKVYNSTIVDGTIICYLDGSSEEFGRFNVNGEVLLKLVESPELPLGEHTLTLKYESSNKNYQNLEDGVLKINLKAEPIDVTKVWRDTDTSKRQDITITLYKDGEVNRTITLNDANNWKHTFEGLPKYLTDGTPIKYTIDESNVPEGYLKIITNNTPYSFTVNNIEVENINVKIDWLDNDNKDGLRPESVTVTVYNNDTKEEVASFDLTEPDWAYRLDLPKYNLEGNRINYTAKNTVTNYATSITDTANSIIITNTHIPEIINITVIKVWDDDNNRYGNRPISIKVNLIKDGTLNNTTTLNADNGWNHTFTGLSKYNAGNLIIYNFTETPIPEGYTFSVTNASYKYIITNSYVSKTKIYSQVINDIEGKVAIEIKVFDENDDEVPNSRLNITLDDDTTFTTINTNRIYVNPNLTAGQHNITIKYQGNGEYSGNTTIMNFTVVPDPNKLIDNLTLNITNLEKNVTDLQNQIDNITQNNLTQLQKNITNLQNQINILDKNITNLQNQINNITNTNITQLKEAIQKLNEKITLMNNTINILNLTIQNQNFTNNITNLQQQITDLKNNSTNYDIRPLIITQNNFLETIIKLMQQQNKQNNAPINSNPAQTTTKTILTLKTVKKLSKRAKKLKMQATLKINGKKVKGKKVTFIIRGKKFSKKTNKKGVAKLTIKKSKLKKLLKKVKTGKKVVVKAKYGKIIRKKYIKIKK